ncbi:hypothetical protein DL768_003907 [Monosporascus sp. mg162]|nr:hypothetical protein DL768_003907 [Monosporascus sp. mg162]
MRKTSVKFCDEREEHAALCAVGPNAQFYTNFEQRDGSSVFKAFKILSLAGRGDMYNRYANTKLISATDTVGRGFRKTEPLREGARQWYFKVIMAVANTLVARTLGRGSRIYIWAACVGPQSHGVYVDDCMLSANCSYDPDPIPFRLVCDLHLAPLSVEQKPHYLRSRQKILSRYLNHSLCDLDLVPLSVKQKPYHFRSRRRSPSRGLNHFLCDLDLIPFSVKQKPHHFHSGQEFPAAALTTPSVILTSPPFRLFRDLYLVPSSAKQKRHHLVPAHIIPSRRLNYSFCNLDLVPSSVKQKPHHFRSFIKIPSRCFNYSCCDFDLVSSLVKQKRHHFSVE